MALDFFALLDVEEKFVVADDLGDGEIDKVRQKRLFVLFAGSTEFARRDVCPREGVLPRTLDGAGDVVVLALVQKPVLDEGARRDDADDVPLHHAAPRFLGIGELFADRDLLAQRDELGDVCFRRVIGNAAHGRALFEPAVPPREREIEELRDAHGVVEEHLVKVAETIENDAVFVLLFDFEIVLHHGRESHRCPPKYIKLRNENAAQDCDGDLFQTKVPNKEMPLARSTRKSTNSPMTFFSLAK